MSNFKKDKEINRKWWLDSWFHPLFRWTQLITWAVEKKSKNILGSIQVWNRVRVRRLFHTFFVGEPIKALPWKVGHKTGFLSSSSLCECIATSPKDIHLLALRIPTEILPSRIKVKINFCLMQSYTCVRYETKTEQMREGYFFNMPLSEVISMEICR